MVFVLDRGSAKRARTVDAGRSAGTVVIAMNVIELGGPMNKALLVIPFVVAAAVLGGLVVSMGSALAMSNEHQVRKCTYGLLLDADRLTCDLARLVDPQ